MLRRAIPVLLGLSAALALTAAVPRASAAPTAPQVLDEARVSLSDTVVEPGQVVTLTASGLLPTSPADIYLLPGARLAQVTVPDGGSIRVQVTIPGELRNGSRQIVLVAIDARAHRAYLPTDITIRGSTATARLGDTSLVPSQHVAISGRRWLAGATVAVALFPERVIIGEGRARSDQSISIDAQMPSALFNGRHVIAVGGPSADGGFGFVELEASVTGGTGPAPGIGDVRGAFDAVSATTTSTSTSSTSTSTTALAPRRRGGGGSVGSDWGTLALVLLLLLLVAGALVATWLRSPEGKRWRDRRRRARLERRPRQDSNLRPTD